MTQQHEANSGDVAADLPPGVGPSFGDVPRLPFEHTAERIVLSSDEHLHLLGATSLNALGGEFTFDRLCRGSLRIEETATPGEVHVEAELLTGEGPPLRIDANVRESWLSRTVSIDDSAPANVRVVRGLFRLAEIASQSTVNVSVQAD